MAYDARQRNQYTGFFLTRPEAAATFTVSGAPVWGEPTFGAYDFNGGWVFGAYTFGERRSVPTISVPTTSAPNVWDNNSDYIGDGTGPTDPDVCYNNDSGQPGPNVDPASIVDTIIPGAIVDGDITDGSITYGDPVEGAIVPGEVTDGAISCGPTFFGATSATGPVVLYVNNVLLPITPVL